MLRFLIMGLFNLLFITNRKGLGLVLTRNLCRATARANSLTIKKSFAPVRVSQRLPALIDDTSAPTESFNTNNTYNFKTGQDIQIKFLQFGPLGGSVAIFLADDETIVENIKARGLIIQKELSYLKEKRNGVSAEVGEVHPAYVGLVREDGRINVSLRPIGSTRIQSTKSIILEALEGSPAEKIPVGDKSTPEDISAYFHGMSKSDFKTAVGSLYKEGKCARLSVHSFTTLSCRCCEARTI